MQQAHLLSSLQLMLELDSLSIYSSPLCDEPFLPFVWSALAFPLAQPRPYLIAT